MSKETMNPVDEESQALVVAAAPRPQCGENAEIATLVAPVVSECVNAVSTLLNPPPQGEMAGAGAIPNNPAVPMINSTCVKATCGGALLLAGLAGYGARAFMQRVPTDADGPKINMPNQPESAQPQKQTREKQQWVPSVVQLNERPSRKLNPYLSSKQNEIMTVALGQGGNRMHSTFWESLVKEHNLNSDGRYQGHDEEGVDLSRIGVYMRGKDRYVPRSCIIDLEPKTLDAIKSSPMARLFKPDNFVIGNSGAGNNWAKGYYTEGAELIEESLDVIRREVEAADCPQGFTIFQTLGGGVGSGMGALLLGKLKDNYPSALLSTFSIHPSPKVSDVVVEPYNAVLGYHKLLEHSDTTFILDNEALSNIATNVLKARHPKYEHLNYIINCGLMDVTAPFRFQTAAYEDLKKQNMSLVPFPRLKFLSMGLAPLAPNPSASKGQTRPTVMNLSELAKTSTNPSNCLTNIHYTDGKYLAQEYNFRGDGISQDAILHVPESRNKQEFVAFIPESDGKTSSQVIVPPSDCKQSCTMVCNTTANKGLFQNIATQFGRMYRRKAFLHWYKGEGMDEMEFQEADKNVRDLITEYQDKEDATIDEEKD